MILEVQASLGLEYVGLPGLLLTQKLWNQEPVLVVVQPEA